MKNDSLKSSIEVKSMPDQVDTMIKMVNKPADIDAVTSKLNIPPFLLNLYLATSTDLSFLNAGLGKATYVPRQVSKRNGGRKSLYYLKSGETTTAGVYITGETILIRSVTRISGKTLKAQTGDTYKIALLTIAGETFWAGQGTLEIEDETKGIGQLSNVQQNSEKQIVPPGSTIKPMTSVWVLWSCVNVEK